MWAPLGTLWGTLSASHAKGVSLLSTPPPPQGGVGGYNHRGIGEEVEWRPLLLFANPLGHRVPATLFIARFMRNDMSGDHYEMINKVALGAHRPGGGCAGCVGVNIAGTPRWLRETGDFWSYAPPQAPTAPPPIPPPRQRAKMFKGCRGQGLHLDAPHG